MTVSRDAEGRITRTFPFRALAAHVLSELTPLPQPGETIFLTLDAGIQSAVEETLRQVPRAGAVVMDPATGDILAMASVPSFDPGTSDRTALEQDETQPLRNRTTSAYAPGATFLPITLLAGFSAGLRDFQHTCIGSFTLGTRAMRCWIYGKDGRHGPQTFEEGMKNSCNTFFYQLGIAAGPEKLAETAEFLGLGRPSGIPLTNEAAGVVPSPALLKSLSPNETWTPGYTATTAIGQGMTLTTPLQMTVVAATLANGEAVFPPRLVEKTVSADGTVTRTEPAPRGQLQDIGIQPADGEVVRSGMHDSVNAPGGNAQKGKAEGFIVAGRTGTAQFWRSGQKDNHTAFLGFAITEDKKATYAFYVFVQGAKSGGGVAAPLAAQILESLAQSTPRAFKPAKGAFRFVEKVE